MKYTIIEGEVVEVEIVYEYDGESVIKSKYGLMLSDYYELFDDIQLAKNTLITYIKQRIKRQKAELADSKSKLAKLLLKNENCQ